MSLVIKKASTEDDILTIEALGREIWHEHYDSIIGENQVNYMLEKFQSKEAVSKQINSDTIYLLAYYGDIPAGYSAYKLEESKTFLSKIYILKEYRGKRIGASLLDEIIKASAGKESIYLTVNKYNENSIKVYEKLGFKTVDSVVTDIGSGYVMDDYIMEKALG